MIKAKVLSTNMSAKPDAPIEMTMEMWVLDSGSLSCPREVIIMTEEEYKALDSVSDTLRNSLLDERETTRKLKEVNEAMQKAIKDLEEKIEQKIDETDLHPDGTIVFKKKRVSELEKEVEELKEENKDLKEENKDLKEKVERLKEELFFFYKGLKYNEIVSELEKEVEELNKSKSDIWLELNTVNAENEKLKEENKYLKRGC